MEKQKIEYSSDRENGYTYEEFEKAGMLAEKYMELEDHPGSIRASEANMRWIYENIPDFVNLIFDDKKVIGSIFTLPCSLKQMNDFLSKKITEQELFVSVRDGKRSYEALYIGGAVVVPDYRRKHIALTAVKKILEKHERMCKKPILFYWSFSEAGKKGAMKLAEETGLEIKARI